jgi:biopolymer transport protein ExbD
LASVTKEPKLPDAKNTEKVKESQLVVLIDEKNRIQIGSTVFSISDVAGGFKTLQDQTNHVYNSVIIKADPRANYGTVLQVMDAAKHENLTNFGLANHIEGSKS